MGTGTDRRGFLRTVALFGGLALSGAAGRPAHAAEPVAPAAASTPLRNRSELIALLAAACEIEHTVVCIYLYAAASLKTWPEDGLSGDRLAMVMSWARDLEHIAEQEMYHLVQAWNLLTAIGGTPYCLHPNLPQAGDYTPVGVPLLLESYSPEFLARSITFERPGDGGDPDTVAEVYDLIASGFQNFDAQKLFIGAASAQADALLSGFADLIPVLDRESALKAISRIQLQGEGTPEDRSASHFGIFSRLQQALQEQLASGVKLSDLAYSCIASPVTRPRGDFGASGYAVLSDPATLPIAQLYESSYALMLLMLQYIFSAADKTTLDCAMLSQQCYVLMKEVLRPLGEQLCRLPSGQPGLNAGPCFGLSRIVALPADANEAAQLVQEGMVALAGDALRLSAERPELPRLASVADYLKLLARFP